MCLSINPLRKICMDYLPRAVALPAELPQQVAHLSNLLFSPQRIPFRILLNGFKTLVAGVFCVQHGVQGVWSVIPIQLAEMSPSRGFRATFPGVTYQIENVRSPLVPH
jgi:hypothetical protein